MTPYVLLKGNHMTVKELIEELKKYDGNLIVSTNGYEGGVSDKVSLRVIDICPNVYTEWYMGEHEHFNDKVSEDCIKEPRLVISRV